MNFDFSHQFRMVIQQIKQLKGGCMRFYLTPFIERKSVRSTAENSSSLFLGHAQFFTDTAYLQTAQLPGLQYQTITRSTDTCAALLVKPAITADRTKTHYYKKRKKYKEFH